MNFERSRSGKHMKPSLEHSSSSFLNETSLREGDGLRETSMDASSKQKKGERKQSKGRGKAVSAVNLQEQARIDA